MKVTKLFANRPELTNGRLLVAVTILAFFSHLALCVAQNPVDAMKARTVQLIVRHDDNSDTGSGVILCQKADSIYILTARHVLDGSGAIDALGGPSERFHKKQSLAINFSPSSTLSIESTPQTSETYSAVWDVALLTVKGVKGNLTGSLAYATVTQPGDEVTAIGYASQSDTPFVPIFAKISLQDSFLKFAPQVEKGFSGGPLFSHSGSLAGIVTQNSGSIATAVPVQSALSAFSVILKAVQCNEPGSQTKKLGEKLESVYRFRGPFLVAINDYSYSFFATPAEPENSLKNRTVKISKVQFVGEVQDESQDPFGFDIEIAISGNKLEPQQISNAHYDQLKIFETLMLPRKEIHVVPKTNAAGRLQRFNLPIVWSASAKGAEPADTTLKFYDPAKMKIGDSLFVQIFCWSGWGGSSHFVEFGNIVVTIEYEVLEEP